MSWPYIDPKSTQIVDRYSWLHHFDLVDKFLRAVLNGVPRAIRVAVLDMGCDLGHVFFSGPGSRQDDRLKGHWFDCLGVSDEPVDEDSKRHRTAILAILLRLLPNADRYVVRVARDAKDLSRAKERIASVVEPASILRCTLLTYTAGY